MSKNPIVNIVLGVVLFVVAPNIAAALASTAAGKTAVAAALQKVATGLILQGGAQLLAGNRALASPPSYAKITTRGTKEHRRVIYGKLISGGAQTSERHEGNKMYYIYAISEGEIDGFDGHRIDGEDVTIDAQGFVTDAKYQYNGKSMVRILTMNGAAGQAAMPELVSEVPAWTNNHLFTGLAYVSVRVEAPGNDKFYEMFPNRFPSYSARVRGKKVYDPRTNQTVFSENPALILLDYLTLADGKNLSLNQIDLDSFKEAADRCDDPIPSGNGTISRYRTTMQVSIGADSETSVIANLLASFDGRISRTLDNKVRIFAGAAFTSEFTFDNSNVLAPVSITRGPDRLDAFSACSISFTDETIGYSENTTDSLEIPSLTTRYGSRITKRYEYPTVPSHAQARRLAKRATYRNNPNYIITLKCRMIALRALGKSQCDIDIEFANAGVKLRQNGEITGIEVSDNFDAVFVSIHTFDSDMDKWLASEEGTPAPSAAPQTGSQLNSLQVASLGVADRLHVAWGDVDNYEVVVEVEIAGVWKREVFPSGTERGFVAGLVSGVTYQARAALKTPSGTLGAWATIPAFQTVTSAPTLAPPVVNSAVRSAAGIGLVAVTPSPSATNWRTLVYAGSTLVGSVVGSAPFNLTASLGAGTYTFTAVAEDPAGNVSPVSNSVQVTL